MKQYKVEYSITKGSKVDEGIEYMYADPRAELEQQFKDEISITFDVPDYDIEIFYWEEVWPNPRWK